MASILQKVLGVDADDTGLVRLSHISEDGVHHADEHTVLEWMTGILDDRDDVGTRLGHIDQVATRTMGKLDRIYQSSLNMKKMGYEYRSNEI